MLKSLMSRLLLLGLFVCAAGGCFSSGTTNRGDTPDSVSEPPAVPVDDVEVPPAN